MDNLVELTRLLHNLIRVGTIADVDHDAARVRIADDDLQTAWIHWVELRSGRTRTWNPPTAGEQCLLFCPGGDPANGIALVGIYSDEAPAPSDSPDLALTRYPDGAVIEYDHKAHQLFAQIPGDAKLHCEGFVDVVARGTVNIETQSAATITAAAGATINADVTINGDTVFNGLMMHGGKVIDSTHGHIGVESGNSRSGPVAS